MSDDVNIKISATDNATATLRAVQAQLNSFSSSIKAIAGTAIAGFGLRELSSFLGDSLKAYGESERAVTMLDRVLKSTGNTIKMTRKEIQDYANTRMSQTTFDDDAIVEAASHLARFRDLSGETFTQTLDAAQDLATVMGTDLVSATQMLGRAMSSPADGMAKLARAGVLFTDSQKEQIKTLDLIGDKAGQQKIILEELRRQFGGAAIDDASTAGGQIKQLTNQIGELKEAIGQGLTPVVQNLVSFISSQFPPSAKQSINALNNPNGDIDNMTQAQILAAFQERQAVLNQARRDEVKLRESMANRNMFLGDDGAFFGIQLGPTLAEQQAELDRLLRQIKDGELRQSVLAQNINPGFLGGMDIAGALRQSASTAAIAVVNSMFGSVAGIAGGAASSLMAGQLSTIMAGDAGAAVGQQIRGMFFGQNWWQQQQQQQQERSLAATESRFLTRGRGQMSPGEQKQIEIEQKQLTVLERMERAFAALDDGMLLHVSGVN